MSIDKLKPGHNFGEQPNLAAVWLLETTTDLQDGDFCWVKGHKTSGRHHYIAFGGRWVQTTVEWIIETIFALNRDVALSSERLRDHSQSFCEKFKRKRVGDEDRQARILRDEGWLSWVDDQGNPCSSEHPQRQRGVYVYLGAERLQSSSNEFTFEVKKGIRELRGNKCFCCGSTDVQIDHIYPKEKGGPSDVHNGLPLCQSCNNKKKKYRYPFGEDAVQAIECAREMEVARLHYGSTEERNEAMSQLTVLDAMLQAGKLAAMKCDKPTKKAVARIKKELPANPIENNALFAVN